MGQMVLPTLAGLVVVFEQAVISGPVFVTRPWYTYS